MIIRFSVEDNDFQELLAKYASNLYLYISEDGEEFAVDTVNSWDVQKKVNKILDKYDIRKKVNEILNPNMHHKITKEDEFFLEEQIRKSFAYFCEKRCPSSKDYLVSKLTVKFMKSMTDKWENGEACYWFQNSNQVITQ